VASYGPSPNDRCLALIAFPRVITEGQLSAFATGGWAFDQRPLRAVKAASRSLQNASYGAGLRSLPNRPVQARFPPRLVRKLSERFCTGRAGSRIFAIFFALRGIDSPRNLEVAQATLEFSHSLHPAKFLEREAIRSACCEGVGRSEATSCGLAGRAGVPARTALAPSSSPLATLVTWNLRQRRISAQCQTSPCRCARNQYILSVQTEIHGC